MIPIQGGSWWLQHAAQITARYPLAGTDWDQHHESVRTGFYSVHLRTETPTPADLPNCDFAEPPLTPEHEEMLF
jgi:hypothetical protein